MTLSRFSSLSVIFYMPYRPLRAYGRMKIPKVKLAMLNSPNPNGERCIYIMVPFPDRYLKKSTNLWILPKDWDEKQQIVLPSNENYEVINNKLSLALAPIRSKILKLEPPIAICDYT